MSQKTSSILTNEGHQATLESIQRKYQLDLKGNVKVKSKLFAIAITPSNEKVFITIKSYEKNEHNEAKFQRAIVSNRWAQKIKGNFMPKVIEFNTFERDNILWMTSMSVFAGKLISQANFFEGNDDIVNDQMIGLLHHSFEVIEQSASGDFLNPPIVSKIIRSTFGHRVISVAPEWTSAHGDLHWGNILDSGVLVDWDSFSQKPKGYDAASIVLFSVSNSKLFERLYRDFFDILQTDSGRVATLLIAAFILNRMPESFKLYEPNIREAVMLIVNPKKIRWPKQSDVLIN